MTLNLQKLDYDYEHEHEHARTSAFPRGARCLIHGGPPEGIKVYTSPSTVERTSPSFSLVRNLCPGRVTFADRINSPVS